MVMDYKGKFWHIYSLGDSMRKVTLFTLCGLTAIFGIICLFCYKNLASVNGTANLSLPMTLIIDAGHGGEDGGATTAHGLKESQLNLDIKFYSFK